MTALRDAEICGHLVYPPFINSYKEIRLVRVDQVRVDHCAEIDGDDGIVCSLSNHSMDDLPPYIAISYTWGNIAERRRITLDGEELWIGFNSWLVLWQARLHRLPHPLWIDVLSIDQSNAVEKSIQVGLMGEIYKGAIYVCASVGLHEADSAFLAEEVPLHVNFYHRRKFYDEAAEPTAESLPCDECGRPLRNSKSNLCYPCSCQHLTEVGINCRGLMSEDEDEDCPPNGTCALCGQEVFRTWYQSGEDTNQIREPRLCRRCVQTSPNAPESRPQSSTLTLHDKWGSTEAPADEPAEMQWQLQWELQTDQRLWELPRESHQRIINALTKFTQRQYFTRLWVRLIMICK